MVTKYIMILHMNLFSIKYIPGIFLLKFLAKTAEKYAKATNTACFVVLAYHQPKMPASMIKKD